MINYAGSNYTKLFSYYDSSASINSIVRNLHVPLTTQMKGTNAANKYKRQIIVIFRNFLFFSAFVNNIAKTRVPKSCLTR